MQSFKVCYGGSTVKEKRIQWFLLLLTLAAIMMLGACKKKVTPPPPPPPPPPPAPTASISVNPNSIQQGQSASLTWQTTNATDITIEGLGSVQPNGSQVVSPTESANYNLVAKGAGGTQNATTRLTVTAPPPPPPPPAGPSDEELFAQNIKDIYFDYDKSDVRADQSAALQADMLFLNQHPNINFTIEGHCDERGSIEYNVALGEKRAGAVKNALTTAAINASRVNVISYGKEKPFCTESNETCWQQNRRAHFVYQK